MSNRPRLVVTQTTRLALTPGLAASINLLRADAAGLTRYLEEQAAQNPALVLDHHPPGPGEWLPRWTDVLPGNRGPDRTEALVSAAGPSLIAHVLAALDHLIPPGPERAIALALTEALEPSGWLGRSCTAIATETGTAPAAVEAVLTRLQTIEPRGLFARTLAECLRLQADEAGVLDAPMSCLLEYLDLLAAGDFPRLARLCKVTEAEVTARFRILRGFNPKPGTAFAGFDAPVREPDLLATRTSEGWEVALNRSALPSVRLIGRPGTAKADLAAAQATRRILEGRNATLLRVGQEILARQRAALDHGLGALCPLSMAEVAQALALHESTVSRIVAGTSVDTPGGTLWLRRLFSGAMGETSAAALRDRLSRIVAAEDATAPLSDAALALRLSETGAEVARRTVAKYRTMLAIPAASLRRRRNPRDDASIRDKKGRPQG